MTPDKRVEEVLEQLFEIKDGFYSSGDYTTKRFAVWELRKALTQYHQDLMSEVEMKIEKAKYPKDSTQGCNCNSYNNALTEAQNIIKLSK